MSIFLFGGEVGPLAWNWRLSRLVGAVEGICLGLYCWICLKCVIALSRKHPPSLLLLITLLPLLEILVSEVVSMLIEVLPCWIIVEEWHWWQLIHPTPLNLRKSTHLIQIFYSFFSRSFSAVDFQGPLYSGLSTLRQFFTFCFLQHYHTIAFYIRSPSSPSSPPRNRPLLILFSIAKIRL